MRDVVCVTPGRRAGRVLAELLIAAAEDQGLTLLPPRIVTPSHLPNLLLEPGHRLQVPGQVAGHDLQRHRPTDGQLSGAVDGAHPTDPVHAAQVPRTDAVHVQRHASHAPMPVLVLLFGVTFNLINAYINGRAVSHLGQWSSSWLTETAAAARITTGLASAVFATVLIRTCTEIGIESVRIPTARP